MNIKVAAYTVSEKSSNIKYEYYSQARCSAHDQST